MKTAVSIFAVLSLSTITAWADFRVDLEPADVAQKLDVWTIASLSVGESGLVQAHNLEYCESHGRVFISTVTKLSSDFSEDSVVLKVMREPGESVSIAQSPKGRELTAADFTTWSYELSFLPQCSHLDPDVVPTLKVNSFFGSTSLSELTDWLMPDNQGPSYPDAEHDYPGNPLPGSHNWRVTETKSPILDATRVTLSARSISNDASLILRCQNHKTEAYIITEDKVDNSRQPVTMRLGDAMAETTWMTPSANNNALLFDDAIEVAKRMFNANDALFRFFDASGASKTVLFRIEGLEQAIEPLREACDW